MNLSLGKPSSSTHCSLQNCFQLWGKWHYPNGTQSICSNFFSSSPTNCILGCILIHFWWEEERFSSCPSFASLFREVEEVVLIPFAWGGHWMKCFSCKAILCKCKKHHCWLYFWVAFHARLRCHLNASVCTFWNTGRVQAMLCISGDQNGACMRIRCLAPRNSKHKGMLGKLCSSKNRC